MISLTEDQVQELIKCYNDPIYFIENYCWIELKEEAKIVPAILYPYQKEILQWLINGESGLVLKSRRVGGSTVVALFLGWKANFRRGVNALLLSRNENSAKKLLNKVKFSLFNLRKHTSNEFSLAEDASWMLNNIAVNNQQLISIGWQDDNGNIVSTSDIESLTTTSESARGDSATFVFMDEMAFLPDQEGSARAARLTTTRGGHWLAISTPNGVGDPFHSWCMRAERKENVSYRYLKVHWSQAGMDQKMIEAATEGLSDSSRLQEMELEFLSSGDPVFSHIHLAACYKPVDEYPEVANEINKYREIVDKSRGEFYYYSGVDSAVGKLNKKDAKRDYHAFTALTKSGVQAYTFYSKEMSLVDWAGNMENLPNMGPIQRIGKVSQLHRQYPGLLQVEINGPGQTVYHNHSLPDDGFSTIIPKQTNVKTKDQLIRQLVIAVESHAIIITDPFTYQSMIVYQRGSMPGTYAAPPGEYYDDTVIALAEAWDILLSTGAIEFSWGGGTDNLQRATTDKIETDNPVIGYGPTVLDKISSTDRMANYIDEGFMLLPTSDLELDRIKEPEFL